MHALITGTTRGVGAALAANLLERDWQVTGIARGEQPAALQHASYRHVRLDLSKLESCESTFRDLAGEIVASKPERVALVNNAGAVAPVRPLARCDAAELQAALTLNLTTPMWFSAHLLRSCEAVPLRIVNLSSGAATSAYPGWGSYCTGKAGLRMVDQVLAVESEEYPELARRDFAVLTYAPGVVATEMQAEIRATSEVDFPRRSKFVDLHESNQLVAETEPAREIADWLESSRSGAHAEKRFGR